MIGLGQNADITKSAGKNEQRRDAGQNEHIIAKSPFQVLQTEDLLVSISAMNAFVNESR